MPTLKTILLALIFGLALVGVAPDTAQAAKPPSNQSTVYSAANVPLVDDDGVTRRFFVSYNFTNGVTTCGYAVNGRDVPNSGTSLFIAEGSYRQEGTTVLSQSDAIAFCVEQFPNRTRVPNDPTPAV
jgi:hypothetical protein